MNLGSPELEMHLRLSIRRQPVQHVRRKRRTIWQFLSEWSSIGFWLSLNGLVLASLRDATSPALIWLFIAWIGMAAVFMRSQRSFEALTSGPFVAAFEILPIANREVFWWHWAEERRETLVATVAFFLLFATVAQFFGKSWMAWGAAAVAAVAQSMFISSLSAALVWFRPGRRFRTVGGLMLIASLIPILVTTQKSSQHPLLPYIESLNGIASYLPTIWPSWGFAAFLPGAPPNYIWFAIPAVLIAGALPWFEEFLAARYHLPFATARAAGGSASAWRRRRKWTIVDSTDNQTADASTAPIEQRIHDLLQQELNRPERDWRRKNICGRIALPWLTPRDRATLDYLLYSKAFATSIREILYVLIQLFGFFAVLAYCFRAPGACAFSVFFAMAYFLFIRHEGVPGVGLVESNGQRVPVHAYFPALTFRSFSAAYGKMTIIEWSLLLPLLVVFWASSLIVAGHGASVLAHVGSWKLTNVLLVIAYTGVVLTPAILVGRFQELPVRFAQIVWSSAVIITVFTPLMFMDRPIQQLASLSALFLVSIGGWLAYDRAHCRNRVDLVVAKPPPVTTPYINH